MSFKNQLPVLFCWFFLLRLFSKRKRERMPCIHNPNNVQRTCFHLKLNILCILTWWRSTYYGRCVLCIGLYTHIQTHSCRLFLCLTLSFSRKALALVYLCPVRSTTKCCVLFLFRLRVFLCNEISHSHKHNFRLNWSQFGYVFVIVCWAVVIDFFFSSSGLPDWFSAKHNNFSFLFYKFITFK